MRLAHLICRYSGVLRGAGAYVPPGARRGRTGVEAIPGADKIAVTQLPQPGSEVVANGAAPVAEVKLPTANGQAAPDAQKAPSLNVTTAGETASSAAPNGITKAKDPANQVFQAFQQFKTAEKEKLVQKRQTIVKKEKESKIAELVAFSKTFKVCCYLHVPIARLM